MKTFKSGFTFLEIMISIGIFGIVAVACLTGYLTSLKSIKSVNDKILALILSEQKIEELKMNNGEINEEEGIFPESEFKWRIELSDITLYDTIEEIEFIPYRLVIEGPSESYNFILPFLKIQKKE